MVVGLEHFSDLSGGNNEHRKQFIEFEKKLLISNYLQIANEE